MICCTTAHLDESIVREVIARANHFADRPVLVAHGSMRVAQQLRRVPNVRAVLLILLVVELWIEHDDIGVVAGL